MTPLTIFLTLLFTVLTIAGAALWVEEWWWVIFERARPKQRRHRK